MKRCIIRTMLIILCIIIVWLGLHLLMNSKPLVSQYLIAHRGNSAQAPENTLSAIQSALNNDIIHIEIDLQITSDNIIVLMHDEDINRTTNGTGIINNMTWAEITNLDAGSSFSKEFAGREITYLYPSFITICSIYSSGRFNFHFHLTQRFEIEFRVSSKLSAASNKQLLESDE